LYTQDTGRRQTIQRHWQHWTHKTQDEDRQSRDISSIGHTRHRTKTNNPETSAALDTQDTERRQTIQRHWQHWKYKTQDEDKPSTDINSIRHTRHRTKTNNPEISAALDAQDTGRRQTIQRHRQHWTHKTQDEDKQSRDICNIGHTRHRTKTNIPETTAALDSQDTERRQTIQKHLQHWTLKTQDEDKQSRDIGSIGHRRHRMKTNNPETSAAFDTQDTGRSQTIQRH
jgi:hypothetical protein